FIFEWLGVLLGVQVYRLIKKRKKLEGITQGTTFTVILGCIFGAAIGNKLMFVFENPQLWIENGWLSLLQGQSIVGGLLGGLIGVEITKKIIGINYSTGGDFVLPLIVGTLIGRIGCFLAGLHDGTFGLPTTLPWGIDFGDGIFRHPTQLYDMLAVTVLGILLFLNRKWLAQVPGLSFKLYLSGYLLWRLLIDGLKPIPFAYWLGLSGIQWACVLSLFLYLPLLWRDLMKKQTEK
ncbi:MAG: prolipoprotein diacylglyceryl transferase family protein, partial [Methylococcales bacterium]